ncbi:MAG: EAL domain-containing protein, partial [Pseudomonadota bacterium]
MAAIQSFLNRLIGYPELLATTSDFDRGRVRAHQLATIHQISRAMMVANLVNAVLVAAFFTIYGQANIFIYIWTAMVLATACTGLFLVWRKGKLVRRETASARGLNKAVRNSTLLGGLWGLLPIIGYGTDHIGTEVLTTAVVSGMMGGGALALHPIPGALRNYVLAMAAGAAIGLIINGGSGSIVMGVLLFVFAFALLRAGFRVGETFMGSKMAAIEIDKQAQTIGMLLRDFEDQARDWLWEVAPDGMMIRGQQQFAKVCGLSEGEFEAFVALAFAGRSERQPGLANVFGLVSRKRALSDVEFSVMNRDMAFWFRVSGRILDDGRFAGVASNITEERLAKEQVARLAHTDMLTGLINRMNFAPAARTLIEQSHKMDQTVSFICFDLDGFKPVNDTLGHQAGDEVLRRIGKRLRGFAKDGDVVARIGGDEFVFATNRCADANAVKGLAHAILTSLSAPISLETDEVRVGASAGISTTARDGDDLGALMHKADLALYRAKDSGRGHALLFEPDMDQLVAEKRQLKQDLRQALERDEMLLVYQPLIDVQKQEVTAFEALMRWRHPKRGIISPVEFIPAAEESGLINDLSAWGIREACRAAADWPESINVAVNLSPVQFATADVVAMIKAVLQETGLNPKRLEVEITESLFIENTDVVVQQLQALKDIGVSVAIDDFGTGYSSLSYLMRFPFDKLKIDKAF